VKPGSPAPAVIRASRSEAGLSQDASAALIHVSRQSWQKYESGTVAMKLGLWELYQFKTGQIWVRPLPLKKQRATLRQGRQENLTPFTAKSQE